MLHIATLARDIEPLDNVLSRLTLESALQLINQTIKGGGIWHRPIKGTLLGHSKWPLALDYDQYSTRFDSFLNKGSSYETIITPKPLSLPYAIISLQERTLVRPPFLISLPFNNCFCMKMFVALVCYPTLMACFAPRQPSRSTCIKEAWWLECQKYL